MKPKLIVVCISLFVALHVVEATVPSKFTRQSADWFQSEEGRRIADNVVSWQSPHGSWPKNGDTASRHYEREKDRLRGTFDNGATTGELRFLARAFGATGESRYQRAFLKGFDHILVAQYPTGGWPQFYPPGDGYPRHITFNDNSMVRILHFLKDVCESTDFAFVDGDRRTAARTAFDRGIQCILNCQIVVNGKRTAWCAQHDAVDLRPRPARSYELESLSGGESAGILQLLMSIDNPSPEVRRAIEAGVAWYESATIEGIRVVGNPEVGRVVIQDPDAPVLWARFYDIESNRPFFCDRDGIPRDNFNELGRNRRDGYSWYGSYGNAVAATYESWKQKWPE
jgi:pectate lyase